MPNSPKVRVWQGSNNFAHKLSEIRTYEASSARFYVRHVFASIAMTFTLLGLGR